MTLRTDKRKLKLDSLWASVWIRNFVVILLLLGIAFRFYNIDQKVYWHDETMTSLRISGHTQAEMVEQVYDGSVIQVGELLDTYQYPNAEYTLEDSLEALREHPEHSPLYYLIARFWMLNLPASVLSIRMLSVVFGLLALPCMYWLCMELFGSSLVSWVSTALFAVSPFHVLYAQEAREYSFWTLTILLSSAACLWALRVNKPLPWTIYGLSIAIGLYVHPFTGFVAISHGLYVLITEGVPLGRKHGSYLASSALALLLFSPWLWVVITRFDQFVGNTQSVNLDRSGSLPLFWLLNLSRVFFDLNQGPSAINPAHYLLAILAIASLFFLWRRGSMESALFITTLIGVTGLAIIGPDLLIEGRRSSITRYAIPCYLGLEIAIAYLLSVKLATRPFSSRAKQRSRRQWRMVAVSLAALGIVSCAVSSQIPVWWHKSYAKSRRIPDAAAWINQQTDVLLVSDAQPAGRILSLSHALNRDVSLQLGDRPAAIDVPDDYSTVYLYLPSNPLRNRLERQQAIVSQPITLQEDEKDDWLWETTRSEEAAPQAS
ncbi:MAG: glycosyltransferase family 39 protein [Elainellaceae cyanobacterium]